MTRFSRLLFYFVLAFAACALAEFTFEYVLDWEANYWEALILAVVLTMGLILVKKNKHKEE